MISERQRELRRRRHRRTKRLKTRIQEAVIAAKRNKAKPAAQVEKPAEESVEEQPAS